LEDEEMISLLKRIGIATGNKEIRINLDYEIGENVKITEGAFEGSVGKVSDIDFEHRKVKVMVELFGRLTPVEVHFEGVEKA
jgi:transcriptional antiterminator NusG